MPAALAAAEASSAPFDAILMDINMHRMGGDAACAALRATGCALPIIAVSGTADRVDYVRRFGFSAVLTKPFTHEALRAALVTHVVAPAAAAAHDAPAPLATAAAADGAECSGPGMSEAGGAPLR